MVHPVRVCFRTFIPSRAIMRVRNPEGVCRGVRKCTVDGSDVDPRRVRILDEGWSSEEGVDRAGEKSVMIDVVLGHLEG